MRLGTHADLSAPGLEKPARSPVGVDPLEQQRREVASIERPVADALHAGEAVEGRAEVDGARDRLHLRAGGDLAGPTDEQRGTHPAFVRASLDALHAAGPAVAVRAVIREVNHDRIPLEVEFLEPREDAADVAILILEHRPRAAGLVGLFLVGLGSDLSEGLAAEARPVRGGRGPRRVRRGEGDEAEKRPGAVFGDEPQGVVGQYIHDVALGWAHDPVLLERRVEILAPVAGRVAAESFEPAGERVVGPLAAVMPLAEDPGGVTRRPEGVGDRLFRQVHAFLAGRDAGDAESPVVASGQEFGAGGGADGLDEEAVEVRAAPGERVDVRRGELAVAVERVVAPAGVIGQQHHHVGRAGGRCDGRSAEEAEEQDEAAHRLTSWRADSRARPGRRRWRRASPDTWPY